MRQVLGYFVSSQRVENGISKYYSQGNTGKGDCHPPYFLPKNTAPNAKTLNHFAQKIQKNWSGEKYKSESCEDAESTDDSNLPTEKDTERILVVILHCQDRRHE
mmetsp:Transcript_2132/g.5032  ORF Transcript_2132/g.5032 Transcript_2132/m.5032 type:complete len:104 (-) Transcript_2132:664-975(-)